MLGHGMCQTFSLEAKKQAVYFKHECWVLETDLLEGFTSLSVEPLLMALLFAQAFSLGGGAGTTFKGSPSCLDDAWLPGEWGSSSRPLKTSFSKERSLSRRLEPAIGAKSSLQLIIMFAQLSIMIMSQDIPLLVVFPGCDDSLPVRERSVAWSSLRQLGCLNEKKRKGPLTQYCYLLDIFWTTIVRMLIIQCF